MKHLIMKPALQDVAWIEEIHFETTRPFSCDDFRVYVEARDGRWYKQKNPIEWRRGRFSALCTFGLFSHHFQGIGAYRVVCLRTGDKPLENVYEAGALPEALAISDKFPVTRIF